MIDGHKQKPVSIRDLWDGTLELRVAEKFGVFRDRLSEREAADAAERRIVEGSDHG